MSLERIPYDQYLDGFWTIYYSGSPVRIFYISNVFWFVLTAWALSSAAHFRQACGKIFPALDYVRGDPLHPPKRWVHHGTGLHGCS